jgi:hypothetical protein
MCNAAAIKPAGSTLGHTPFQKFKKTTPRALWLFAKSSMSTAQSGQINNYKISASIIRFLALHFSECMIKYL